MKGRPGERRLVFVVGLAVLAVVASTVVLPGAAVTGDPTDGPVGNVRWTECGETGSDVADGQPLAPTVAPLTEDGAYTATEADTSTSPSPTNTSGTATVTSTRTATTSATSTSTASTTTPSNTTATSTVFPWFEGDPWTGSSDHGPRVTLADAVHGQGRGDVVELTFEFCGGADEARVTLGSSETVNFEVQFTVRDGDHDGTVVVEWNTARSPARPDAGLSVKGDSTRWTEDTFVEGPTIVEGVTDPVEPEAYPVSVVTATSDSETDVGTIFVEERSAVDLTVATAPARIPTFETIGDVRNITSNAPTDATIAVGEHASDWVLIRLRASGLSGYTSDAADFDDSSDGVTITVEEHPETVEPNAAPVHLRLAGNARLLKDGANDTYTLAFRASQLLREGADVGDRFTATVTVGEANNVTETEQHESTTFALVEGRASIERQDGEVFAAATEAARVTGTSTWATGTRLLVHLRSSANAGNRTPFEARNDSAVVTSDGTWSATFDLSAPSDGQSVRATLFHVNSSAKLASVSGSVGQLNASVQFTTQVAQDDGTLVVVESVTLGRGGFVVIHEGGPSGPVVGSSDYLPAGSHGAVGVRLAPDSTIGAETELVAVAHLDTNDNRQFGFDATGGAVDEPYVVDGSPAASRATVLPGDSDTTERSSIT